MQMSFKTCCQGRFISRNLRPLQICTFARYILDLLAFVFFFQHPVFQQRKLPEDASQRNVVINTQKNCYFHNILSRQCRIYIIYIFNYIFFSRLLLNNRVWVQQDSVEIEIQDWHQSRVQSGLQAMVREIVLTQLDRKRNSAVPNYHQFFKVNSLPYDKNCAVIVNIFVIIS